MKISHINDIPVSEYPVYISMLNNTLVRFSKWECAKYWEKRGMNYTEALKIYDKHIRAVDELIHAESRKSVA